MVGRETERSGLERQGSDSGLDPAGIGWVRYGLARTDWNGQGTDSRHGKLRPGEKRIGCVRRG